MAQTMAEHLVEQGIAQGKVEGRTEGRAEGKAEGRAEGKAEGQAEEKQAAVLKLLRLRFETVPESVTNQISSIRNFSRLDALFEKALTVQTLDEIGLQNDDS